MPVAASKSKSEDHALFHRRWALFVFPLLSVTAGYCLWYQGFENGLFNALRKFSKQLTPTYPGTEQPLRQRYIGIKPIDAHLSVLVGFFASIVDGTSNDLTLFSIDGLGQFGAGWTLFMLEAMRTGNRGKAVSFVGTYGILVQNFSFAVTTPLYLLLHLWTSPIALSPRSNSMVSVSSLDLFILPVSVTLGYIIPSLLMVIPAPSLVSYSTHQALIAFWQAFPIWTVVIHWAVKQMVASQFPSQKPVPSRQNSMPFSLSTRRVYRFTFFLCMITRVPVLMIAGLPASLVSSMLPKLTSLSTSTLLSVYVPSLPLPGHPISSIAGGCHTFLLWDLYIAGAASIIWATILYRNSLPNRSLGGIFWRVGAWTLIAGPFGALALLFWRKDFFMAKEKVKEGL